jgi:acetyl-CoA synthase
VSKIICSAAIRGAHKIVERAESKCEEAMDKWGPDQSKCEEAMDKWGPDQEIGFPNTAYYLPIIYGMSGIAVKKLRC